jgi:hypothetical protein
MDGLPLLLMGPPPDTMGQKPFVDMCLEGGLKPGKEMPAPLQHMMFCMHRRGDTFALLEKDAMPIELIDELPYAEDGTWMFRKTSLPSMPLPTNLEALYAKACTLQTDTLKTAQALLSAQGFNFEPPQPVAPLLRNEEDILEGIQRHTQVGSLLIVHDTPADGEAAAEQGRSRRRSAAAPKRSAEDPRVESVKAARTATNDDKSFREQLRAELALWDSIQLPQH